MKEWREYMEDSYFGTRNFHEKEFRCKCGKCAWSEDVSNKVSGRLLEELQRVRDLATLLNEERDFKIRISSGVRCEARNREVGGEKNSYHCQGLAADIQPMLSDELHWRILRQALMMLENFAYVEIHDTYIHCDIGKERRNKIIDLRTKAPDIV